MSETGALEMKEGRLLFRSAEDWRAWLQANHSSRTEAWLLYYKKGKGGPSISYDDSVKEALCFGWVDSVIRRVDDVFCERRFSPRKKDSSWAPSNLGRLKELVQDRKMTDAGRAVLPRGLTASPLTKRSAKKRSSTS